MVLLPLLVAASSQEMCSDATSTTEIIECESAVYKLADSQMAYDWRQALARMKRKDAEERTSQKSQQPTLSEALLESQRKWIAFRDSQCRLEGYRMRGGSGQGYSTTICLIRLTNERAATLRKIDF